MDKEEAMKILKDFHDKSALFSVRTALETLHPELKESEDEKIRKFLIKWIQDNYYHGTIEIPTKTLIAWLEKQGEQKTALSEEELTDFEKSLKHVMEETLECGDIHNLKADADLLLRLVKPTDEDMKEALRTEYEKGRVDAFAQMQKEWSNK